jgi:uncharacterized protein
VAQVGQQLAPVPGDDVCHALPGLILTTAIVRRCVQDRQPIEVGNVESGGATVELSRLIASLSKPEAYPHPVPGKVEVFQTHISVVFLAGPFAYKIKKPVTFDFLDFGSLARRHHFCQEEVRLNRRLAADVYLEVVPITSSAEGLRVEGQGEPIEWAVKMRRLPEEATLREWLVREEVGPELIETLASRVAAFHRAAEAGPDKSPFGRLETVRRNLLDIYAESMGQVGQTVCAEVHRRLRQLTEDKLDHLRSLIDARAARGVTRDTHGDLHLDHVYYFPERQPPADLLIIDCIEFNERFRFTDPVADIAFLVMDLVFRGRRDLSRVLAEGYFRASGDEDGWALLPLYTAYRATVRGLVEGLKLGEPEVPEGEHPVIVQSARAHWLLALTELEEPARRPCLILVGGLPGAGKSTLARALAARAGFHVIRSDEIRKDLAGIPANERSPLESRAELYSPAWNERTYVECLSRAETLVQAGGRVLVDASFREEGRRRIFLEAAIRWGIPGAFLACRAAPEVVQARLNERKGDASDADWSVHNVLARQWEKPGVQTRRVMHEVNTEGAPQEAVERALGALTEWGLAGEPGSRPLS